MHFKGCGPVLFALLVVAFIVGAYAPDYETFLSQHYSRPKSNVGNCNIMMQKRGMTKPTCKKVNSFIHAFKNKIIAVCGSGGEPYGDSLWRSCKKFPITACEHHSGSDRLPRNYRGNTSNRYIVVCCSNGKPVQSDEGHII